MRFAWRISYYQVANGSNILLVDHPMGKCYFLVDIRMNTTSAGENIFLL
jgi:hypothetical protein